ncbi:hypothetical protein [Microbulbifer spongiae]|uniref:Uncharacterized protein n=1 Tax=Microbulbifer spongiae TaxID=2944933 RepID=A0ABY9EDK0_9GAMM|nr:hypothetical protein [Microbulbifer sp. MI-G]WKD49604.1 hypothetical protein M8T91_17205 [Microbulbifer sp. MI-G]
MFKQIWKGWTTAVSVIFTPLFLIVSLVQPNAPESMLFAAPLVPFIAAGQGVLIGALVCLGLRILEFKNQYG